MPTMMNRRQFSARAAAAAAFAATSPSLAAVGAAKPTRRGELSALRTFAEATHPRGRDAAADPEWRRSWTALEAQAGRLSDGAYFIALRRALGWFKDGHTTILPFEFTGGVPEALKNGPFGRRLPLRVSVFDDGAFITAAQSANKDLLGARVLRVGSLSTEEIIRKLAVNWPGNTAWAHRQSGQNFASPAFLQGLEAIRDPSAAVPFVVSTTVGTRSVNIASISGPSSDRTEVERPISAQEGWAKSEGHGNYVKLLPDRKAIYISIDSMGDDKGRTFEQLTRAAFEAIAGDSAERVVVDLRRNGGGDNYLGEPLRKRLGASRFNRPGGLYVLVGPRTFSAAQNLANRLERETFALFIGNPTGGAPNHFGDAKLSVGSATGITAIVSTIPWFDSYPQDQRPWIMPDELVPDRYENWWAGRDPALEAALSHRPVQALDELHADRVYYFRRASQSAKWIPFWI